MVKLSSVAKLCFFMKQMIQAVVDGQFMCPPDTILCMDTLICVKVPSAQTVIPDPHFEDLVAIEQNEDSSDPKPKPMSRNVLVAPTVSKFTHKLTNKGVIVYNVDHIGRLQHSFLSDDLTEYRDVPPFLSKRIADSVSTAKPTKRPNESISNGATNGLVILFVSTATLLGVLIFLLLWFIIRTSKQSRLNRIVPVPQAHTISNIPNLSYASVDC